MTVAELIEALGRYNPQAKVQIELEIDLLAPPGMRSFRHLDIHSIDPTDEHVDLNVKTTMNHVDTQAILDYYNDDQNR